MISSLLETPMYRKSPRRFWNRMSSSLLRCLAGVCVEVVVLAWKEVWRRIAYCKEDFKILERIGCGWEM